MKFELMDKLLMFIPEDDADVFSLGQITPHFSHTKSWTTKKDIPKLNSIVINIKDIYTILCMVLKEREHHFIKREL